ncbi:anthranilate phosphoribosyltransferase [Polynucleobacter meluiroseus]|uniref:Anthranilate phosphoribosyltransferase n=1 Tax=Polynucleobacter meluiroseus TaxID=1938814 RepID=A0A240E1Y8_9BURK|nr:anthranilate phosphoribosyltransferase [Polynucleobacter meluiroseus]SNX28944.1 anthranilate phosphoribosyltransferase [Polynucleobacter meluiroseus]
MSISPQAALQRCIENHELLHDEMTAVMRLIMSGELPSTLMAGILVALRTKKETVGEITAAAQVMREFATPVHVTDRANLVDVVGTGGDGAHTFNISTAAMFVAAAAGAKVAKHGNRSVSSKSGSADLLEALGVQLTLSPEQVARCIDHVGMGFMYAPNHHPAMKNVASVRKDLGVRTIFNILGPLTNPADAKRIVMGVFHADLVGIQIRVLQALGMQHALVVYGRDGLDEISLEGSTLVGELKNGLITEYELHPNDFGLNTAPSSFFKVSNAEESKEIILGVLNHQAGPASDIVTLNAGAVLYVGGVASDIASGIQMAKSAIHSGAALRKLNEFVASTQNNSIHL